MGNEISTPAAVGNAITIETAFNAPRKFLLSIKILFEILSFVKFYEAPNIFLVNRHLLPICQVYFHSGTVGHNKNRIVRYLTMQLSEGIFTISVKRNGILQSVPVPEVDPPEIFKALGHIKVKNCCQIQAAQFFNKFQSLLNSENNMIICACNFFPNTASPIADESEKQINSNASSGVVMVDEKQLFLNLIEQKRVLLELKADGPSAGVARWLSEEPMIAGFNGCLSIIFKNEWNLCGLEEDAELIYEWISSTGTRELQIKHYDAQKAHVNKMEAEKMDLKILLPRESVVPEKHMQKICNGNGDQLAALRTIFVKLIDETFAWVYIFYTKSEKYGFEIMEEGQMGYRKTIKFR